MSGIDTVLLTLKLTDEQKLEFENILPSALYKYKKHDNVTEEDVKSAGVIIGSISPELLKSAQNLKWMQLLSAGSEHMQAGGVFPKNAVLTNASGSYGDAMAEYMLGMLLTIQKNLHICRDNQNEGQWKKVIPTGLIDGSITLVIGLGDIGGAFARRMKALGSYVVGVRRSNADAPDYVDELHLTGELDSLLPRADIIALSLPATNETRHILSRERIGLLKQNAIIVNVGRGAAIDTDGICDALYGGKIGGAALDVTNPEPLPEGHLLWNAPNCLITPHVSGSNNARGTYERIINLCLYNFRAFVTGGAMRNVVDFKRGY